MSSKLRLNDLPFDSDEIDDSFYDRESVSRQRHRPLRQKKDRDEVLNYSSERSMKRRNSDGMQQ